MDDIRNKKYSELFYNILIFGIGLLGTKLVQFLLLPYFTSVLTTSEFGVIDLGLTIAGLVVPIITFGLPNAILRFGLSNDTNKAELLFNSIIILAVSILLSLIIYPLIGYYETLASWKTYIILIIVTQAIQTNMSLFIKANNRIILFSINSVLTAFFIGGGDIYFISYRNMGVKGYFISEIFGNLFSIALLSFAGQIFEYIRSLSKFNFTLLKSMLIYSIPLIFNSISWWIISFSDRIIIDIFYTTSDVGLYSVAAKFPAIISIGLSVFTQAWIMSAVREYENDRNSEFFNKVYKIYIGILLSVTPFIILIIKHLIKIYIGNSFQDSWVFVPYLLIGTAFMGISNFYGGIYAAAKTNILEVKST